MAQLIMIGNSKGVRLPKNLIEEAQLGDCELGFKVLPEGILIHPIKAVREGWKEQFFVMAEQPLSAEEKDWLNADLESNQADVEWTW